MRTLTLCTSFLMIGMMASAQKADFTGKYPETKKGTQTDEYFGTKVSDPYRWLEDDRAKTPKAGE